MKFFTRPVTICGNRITCKWSCELPAGTTVFEALHSLDTDEVQVSVIANNGFVQEHPMVRVLGPNSVSISFKGALPVPSKLIIVG